MKSQSAPPVTPRDEIHDFDGPVEDLAEPKTRELILGPHEVIASAMVMDGSHVIDGTALFV